MIFIWIVIFVRFFVYKLFCGIYKILWKLHTFSAPWSRTQNDGTFPSSLGSSLSDSSSSEIPCILAVFSVGKGNTKCRESALGLPTSATDMKPQISIVFARDRPVRVSKSAFLEYV